MDTKVHWHGSDCRSRDLVWIETCKQEMIDHVFHYKLSDPSSLPPLTFQWHVMYSLLLLMYFYYYTCSITLYYCCFALHSFKVIHIYFAVSCFHRNIWCCSIGVPSFVLFYSPIDLSFFLTSYSFWSIENRLYCSLQLLEAFMVAQLQIVPEYNYTISQWLN